jgi:hypothetical protein
MSMCRFSSKDDEGYKQVSGEIKILVAEIQQKMEQAAFESEKLVAEAQVGSPSQTTTASTSYCM